jgi:hypothetical protein
MIETIEPVTVPDAFGISQAQSHESKRRLPLFRRDPEWLSKINWASVCENCLDMGQRRS